jgi:hypothetical protein
MARQPGERREFVRIFFNMEVRVSVDGRIIRSDKGIDISMSGLRLTTTDTAPAGAPCQVVIRLNKGNHPEVIEADGKIVRSGPGSLAIEFTGLDPDGYHHLCRLIMLNVDDPDEAEREFTSHWGLKRPVCQHWPGKKVPR